jgi:trimethylamine-N-oxide reductase (cytochrome c)
MTALATNERVSGLTRRRLLVSSASLGAVAGIGGLPPARAATANGEVLSGSHWGVFHAKVENGRFVSLRPWDKDPHPTAALNGVQDIVYGPSRIRTPMVRRAWLEKGPGAAPETRGKGDFVRVSWDQALDLVAREIRRVQTDFGPWAVYGGSYGWRSAGRCNPQSMLKRLLNLSGGFVDSSEDYSKAAIERIMPYVVGSVEAEGPQSTWPTVMENTGLMVFWGCSPLNNNNIANSIADHKPWGWFDDMQKAGKQAIFIDPVRTDACKQLNGEWIAPRPQTDTAMMIGIAHTLLSENLHDRKFLATYTRGFEPFSDYLLGKPDGVAKTAEWAAEICGIPAATLRDLAHRFAKNRTLLVGGWAMQRQQHGEQTPWMLITLACMLGQIGLPGGGFVQRYHLDSGGAPPTPAPALGGMSSGERPKDAKPWPAERGATVIPCARVVDMLLHPGAAYEFNGRTFRYPDARLTYWVGGNPFHHHQDRNRMVAAWQKFETFIVQDFQWTASARMADIVLPAATTCEHNDIERVGPASGIAILAMKQVIEPVFEARSDYDIFVGLARRLGFEQEFTTGKTEMDWIRSIYEGAAGQAKAKGLAMPDFDTFWNGAGLVEFEVPEAARKWKVCRLPRRPAAQRAADAVGPDRDFLDRGGEDEIRRLPAASDLAGAGRVAGPEGRQVSVARQLVAPGIPAALAALRQCGGARAVCGGGARAVPDQPGGCRRARHCQRRRGASVQRPWPVPGRGGGDRGRAAGGGTAERGRLVRPD